MNAKFLLSPLSHRAKTPTPIFRSKLFGTDGYKLNDALEEEIEAIILGEHPSSTKIRLGKAVRIDDATGRDIEFAKASIA